MVLVSRAVAVAAAAEEGAGGQEELLLLRRLLLRAFLVFHCSIRRMILGWILVWVLLLLGWWGGGIGPTTITITITVPATRIMKNPTLTPHCCFFLNIHGDARFFSLVGDLRCNMN